MCSLPHNTGSKFQILTTLS